MLETVFSLTALTFFVIGRGQDHVESAAARHLGQVGRVLDKGGKTLLLQDEIVRPHVEPCPERVALAPGLEASARLLLCSGQLIA